MEKIIRAIILNDGHHDKYIVCEGNLHKNSFYSFVNRIALRHDESYNFKTVHYEDLEDGLVAEAFEVIDASTEMYHMYHSEKTAKAFEALWNSEDAVDGVDVY